MAASEAHAEACAHAIRRVITSLLDMHNSYQNVVQQVAMLKSQLAQEQTSASPDTAKISILNHTLALSKRYLAARKAHDIAFKAGLRNPSHSDPTALEKFLEEDAKKYVAMTTEWNSKCFMALKAASPEMVGSFLKENIEAMKHINPRLAERMSLWDKDGKAGSK